MIDEKCLIENLPNVDYFDLYQHLKSNLNEYKNNCRDRFDNMTNFGYYCLNCKVSFCNDCTFQTHKDHMFLKKSQYEMEPRVLDNVFKVVEDEIGSNKIIFNSEEIKNQMIQNLSDQIYMLHQKLDSYKEKKIEEINFLFEEISKLGENLNKIIYDAKTDIDNFFTRQKLFFNCDKYNNERENTVFLLIFELLNSYYKKNNEIVRHMSKLQENAYIIEENMNQKLEEISKILDQFSVENQSNENQSALNEIQKGISFLDNDLYVDIKNKLARYDEHIDNFQTLTFLNISKSGSIKELEKLIYLYDRKNINQTNIQVEDFEVSSFKGNYNSQQDIKTINHDELDLNEEDKKDEEKDENEENKLETEGKKFTEENKSPTLHSMHNYNHYRSTSPIIKGKLGYTKNIAGTAPTKKAKKDEVPNHEAKLNMSTVEFSVKTNIKSKNDVILDNRVIQRYFAYQTLTMINKLFRIGEKNLGGCTSSFAYLPVKITEVEEEHDVCKPIIGTNEIQIYDRKKRILIRKKVRLDKQNHGYSKFLDGIRYLVVNDKMYITGGRDEVQDYKVVLSYDLKDFTLKRLGDMLNSRSYHSIQFNELFKTILVIGGQKNATCEIYDMKINRWRMLPSLNHPRANVSIYFDDIENSIYAFFGIEGDISGKAGYYSYYVEVLKLKFIKHGWINLDYQNKSDLILKQVYLEICPFSNDKILIYGAKNERNVKRRHFAVYLTGRKEIIKVDDKIMADLKKKAKNSPRLSQIISNI